MENIQNTPFTASKLLAYANLQIAAEALYGKLKDPAGNPSDLIANGEITGKIETHLTDGNKHSSKFTTTQAAEFVKDWTILSHLPSTSTGFSGTLFKNIHTGELVLSFRSTEFIEDQVRDSVVTNTSEIKEHGWAFGQISDMEEWFSSLKTAGLIPNGQKINVTGYSLGGHLATAFHILHSEQIEKTFTFNGAGVGSIGGDKVTTDEELYSYC